MRCPFCMKSFPGAGIPPHRCGNASDRSRRVPNHGDDCETRSYRRKCSSCKADVTFFECTCGSVVIFDPGGEHVCRRARTLRVYCAECDSDFPLKYIVWHRKREHKEHLRSKFKAADRDPGMIRPVRVFAYGPWMSQRRMSSACPAVANPAAVYLPDHDICFPTGSARDGGGIVSVVASSGSVVWGVLYEVEIRELETLGRMLGEAYSLEVVEVKASNGQKLTCRSHVIRPTGRHVVPGEKYIRMLLDAANEWRLPREYMDRIHQRVGGAT